MPTTTRIVAGDARFISRCNVITAWTQRFIALTIGATFFIGGPPATLSAEEADISKAEREFTLHVLPVLKQKCLGCHGGDPEDIKGGYDVTTRALLLKGGESEEPAIVPGNIDEGTLLDAVRWNSLEMPPKENDRLTPEQIAAVERWIEAGAPWPTEQAQARYRMAARHATTNADGTIFATSGGTSDDWTHRRYDPADVWAFAAVQPLTDARRSELDQSSRASTSNDLTTWIDALITEKLSEAGLPASPSADARTLIRRATFDLHGLPPTPEQVAAFVAASKHDSQAAWSHLIDRLLASPRYGEHWARHWLDVTRYADTGGMSNDFERSNMWRYRDYVIRAFNNDKPYNEFILEQLAGDELADHSVRQRKHGDWATVYQTQLDGDYTDEEAEWIVATGFLRLGPWDNAMIEKEEARQIWLDDLVNITGQTFLSTTMRCVKCHDHKFDPIPTRDYYRLYAAFATTQMAERNVPLLPQESQQGFETGKAHVQRMLDFATHEKNKLIAKREAAARAWFDARKLPYKNHEQRNELPDEEKPPRHVGLNHVEQGQLKVREQDEWIWTRRLERYQPMAQSVYNASSADLAWNGARKLRIDSNHRDDWRPPTHILVGGALTALGDAVGPGVLSAVAIPATPIRNTSSDTDGTSSHDPYRLTDEIHGRRLGLARWIADPANALTTRSIVNRVWQYHFGVGIAANANNFGAKGAKPTHPELLDQLATDFVTHGWKLKRLHRQIMLSEAYQRSARPPSDDAWKTIDPDNRLLSYFKRRRLTAEELRDAILFVTGELRHRTGGVPIMPEINLEVALQPRMIQFSLAPAYQPSPTPDQRNARSIYAYKVRGQADPFTEIFNQPNPNESCELRETASVTPQAFTLFNSDMMTDRSIAFANRLQRFADSPDQQIDRAFLLALNRPPNGSERQRMTTYFKEMTEYHSTTDAPQTKYPTRITRSLVEEFSGQPFEYDEILPVFENYHADLKPSDVSAETRALADMCLLLLNTNEFMFVD